MKKFYNNLILIYLNSKSQNLKFNKINVSNNKKNNKMKNYC